MDTLIPPESSIEGRLTPYSAPALDKGLDIIELLSKEEFGLTRRDIAERLGRSVGEIFRMLDTLVRRSYIVQRGDVFVLSTRLLELSYNFPPTKRLLHEATPRMRDLARRCQQSCHLTVLNGLDQLVIAQVDAPEGVGFTIKIGSRLDLLKSVSGLVLLAFRQKVEVETLITHKQPGIDAAEREAYLETIDCIRERGYANRKSIQFSGVQAISYPIFDLEGHAMASLTVPFLARLDDDERPAPADVERIVKATAAEINMALSGFVCD